jgi:RecA/RadA recombinase
MAGPMRADAAATVPAARPELDSALETLRGRGLALRRASEPLAPSSRTARPALPTGHPPLDAALRTGGWPRGALTSLDATPGSGATTLALGSLAASQAGGGIVGWLDVEGSFDPATATRLGVNLSWLLVARPTSPEEGVELAAWLARTGLIDALVLDLGPAEAPRGGLERLATLLARVGGVVLLLGGRGSTAGAASVRVALERVAWLAVGRDLVGQRVLATVVRHRWALAGERAELDLWFAEGRRIDPWLAAAATPMVSEALPGTEERPALRVVGA